MDFYIPSENLAIQVCYEFFSNQDTYDRETKALAKLQEHFPGTRCLILTMSEEDEITIGRNSVQVVPMWKWLTVY